MYSTVTRVNKTVYLTSFKSSHHKKKKFCNYMLVTQWCPTLCDPMDYSSSGSSVHGFSRQEYRNE